MNTNATKAKPESMLIPKLIKAITMIALLPLIMLILIVTPVIVIVDAVIDHLTDEKERESH